MCGRFSFVASQEKIQHQLGLDFETGANLRINFNIAPTQHAYVITNEKPRALQYLTWGLIPSWSNDGKNIGQLINARSEGIETKPSFRVPIRKTGASFWQTVFMNGNSRVEKRSLIAFCFGMET